MDPDKNRGQKGGCRMNLNQVASLPSQTVVVVNGNTDVVGMLENVLDAGRYDMVFVEASDRAYSQIKSVHPNLVILCTRIEALEYEGQDFDADPAPQEEEDDSPFIPSPVAMRMN
jgi:hypothetical protein